MSAAPTLSQLLSQHPILQSIASHLSSLDLLNLGLTSRAPHLYIYGTRNPVNAILRRTHCTGQEHIRNQLTVQGAAGTLRGWAGTITPPLPSRNPKCKLYSRFRCQGCYLPVCAACKPVLTYGVKESYYSDGKLDRLANKHVVSWELPLAYAEGDHLTYARVSDYDAVIMKEHRRRHYCSQCDVPLPQTPLPSNHDTSREGEERAHHHTAVKQPKIRHQRYPCTCHDRSYNSIVSHVLAPRSLCWDCGVQAWEADRRQKPTFAQKTFAPSQKDPLTGKYKKGAAMGYKRYCNGDGCTTRVFRDCASICAWCDGWLDNAVLDFGAPQLRPPSKRRKSAESIVLAAVSTPLSAKVRKLEWDVNPGCDGILLLDPTPTPSKLAFMGLLIPGSAKKRCFSALDQS